MSDYERKAQAFLEKTGTQFEVQFLFHGPYFDNDKEKRDVYEVTLSRDDKRWTFKFGQSIARSRIAREDCKLPRCQCRESWQSPHGKLVSPTAYDVLACLQKYDPGTFADFCAEFGYDEDSRKAEKTYFEVQEEWSNVCRMWTEEERKALEEIS